MKKNTKTNQSGISLFSLLWVLAFLFFGGWAITGMVMEAKHSHTTASGERFIYTTGPNGFVLVETIGAGERRSTSNGLTMSLHNLAGDLVEVQVVGSFIISPTPLKTATADLKQGYGHDYGGDR